MRIVAGKLGGRRLHTPKTDAVRPTAGKVREALFAILAPQIIGAGVVDLCAGTGAIGIEALSRGAAWVEFVERSPSVIAVLRHNLERLRPDQPARVIAMDAMRYLKTRSATAPLADVVFVDPPYASGVLKKVLPLLGQGAMMRPGGLVIVEHFHKDDPPSSIGGLVRERSCRYGDSVLTFFRFTPPTTDHTHGD